MSGDSLPEEKKCKKCGEVKPLIQFSPAKRTKDRHHTYCKLCKNALENERHLRYAKIATERRLANQSQTKLCSRCKEYKPVSMFTPADGTKDGYYTYCRKCNSARQMEIYNLDRKANAAKRLVFYHANKDAYKLYNQSKRLRTQYGMTEEDYLVLLDKQSGKCAICGTTQPKGNGNRMKVDHDHATGKVRGLLCNACNTAIGFAGDNPERLRVMATYLEEHNGD